MKRLPTSRPRMTLILLLISLVFILLACTLNRLPPQGNVPTAAGASPSSGSTQIQPTQVPIPSGWKLSTDPSGSCQVWTPADWQIGSDFFLEAEKTDPGPIENAPGQYPPNGLVLWGIGEGTPVPAGHQFQVRMSLVTNDSVCSVWRIKAEVDFTDAEKTEMEQVGKTLQEVVK
jgi:hypothetical protein